MLLGVLVEKKFAVLAPLDQVPSGEFHATPTEIGAPLLFTTALLYPVASGMLFHSR